MGLRTAELALSVLFHVVHFSYASDEGKACKPFTLHACPANQTCIEALMRCRCPEDLVMSGDTCTTPEASAGGGHAAIVAVILVLAAVLVTAGLILVVRKYQLIDWARRRLEARRNRDVMYEDVMIGQDDPPLTP